MGHSPVQSEYQGDKFLEPREIMVGAQDLKSTKENEQRARKAQMELAERSRANEEKLAEDIIEESRTQLMLKFRFLDRALWRMNLVSQRKGMSYPIGTNGKIAFYDPQRVIARFRQSFDEETRDYLHMVLHCIFRHPYDRDHKSEEAWSLTCDIIVESVVMDLCAERFPSEDDAARRSALDEIALVAGGLLPNKIYDLLKGIISAGLAQQYHGYSQGTISEWRRLFERDDHAAWPANARMDDSGSNDGQSDDDELVEDDQNPEFQSDGIMNETLGDDDQQQAGNESNPESDDTDGSSGDAGESGDDDENAGDASDPESSELKEQHINLDKIDGSSDDSEDDRKDWEDIAKEIEMNLETFSKEWGEQAGNLIANLTLANRRTYDYTDFLRRFMTITEQIKLNPEEFDYTYYMFGMNMYGNMPFIEPLEYKETEAMRDFVIAIDTSESVSGSLVKKFVQHTFNILKESEGINTTVNIHVIQADSKVQSDLKIKDLREVDKLLDGFAVRGFGGTDFRPVFDYVDMLRNHGELADLKGMIYFTDGIGQFPEKVADYDTAFVFVDDGSRELPPVPPWAMKLVIDERDIERMH